MIESPLYQEIVEESKREGETRGKRETILDFLVGRFGSAAKELEVELKAVEFERLSELARFAAKCRNLAAFRKRLSTS
jgi:predicted transposase YdaD